MKLRRSKRHPVKVETPLPVKPDLQAAQTALLREYKSRRFNFQLTSRSCLMLKRMATDASIVPEIKAQPLLKKLMDASQELMMTELEIAVWSLYLEEFVWSARSLSLRDMLYMTGYAAKTYTSDECRIFLTYLSDKIRKFAYLYKRWHSQVNLTVDLVKLNYKFTKLTKPLKKHHDRKIINYNFYVDEILDTAPPYKTGKEKADKNRGFISDAESVVSVEDNTKSPLTLSMLNPDNPHILESFVFKPSVILDSQELGYSWTGSIGSNK